MTNRPSLRILASVALCLSLLIATAAARQIEAQGAGKANKPIKKLIHLEAGTTEPKANGIAKLLLKNKGKAKQDFMVVGANLKASAIYHLFVNGVEIDSQMAEPEQGEGEGSAAVVFHYASNAKPDNDEGIQPLPDALNPVTNARLVEIKDDSGVVVLSGEFPAS